MYFQQFAFYGTFVKIYKFPKPHNSNRNYADDIDAVTLRLGKNSFLLHDTFGGIYLNDNQKSESS